MKKIAILLSVFFIGFSQAQSLNNQNTKAKKQKKEHKKTLQTDPDARVFVIKEQKKTLPNSKSVLTKEEALKNKKGYKRVNIAINKERKIEQRKERKTLRAQDRVFNKYIKESKKRRKKLKKEAKKVPKSD